MPKTVLPSAVNDSRNEGQFAASLSLAETRQGVSDWLLDCEIRQHSSRTIQARRDLLDKFFWFAERNNYTHIGTREIRAFFAYLGTAHNEPEGRFGNPKLTAPLRPVSIHSYYKTLKALYRWLESEEVIEADPMRRLKPPVSRTEVKQPLTSVQLHALIAVAKRSENPLRNVAIVLTLADTGIRATELCQLKIKDVDLESRSIRVLGKANKYRTVYLGRESTKSISKYLKRRKSQNKLDGKSQVLSDLLDNDVLFKSERGAEENEPLTRGGLLQLIERLSINAGIPKGLRNCHSLRRTNAVNLLRNGASAFAVQNLLGHSDLSMTRRYVNLADADIEATHRQCSPIDRLGNN